MEKLFSQKISSRKNIFHVKLKTSREFEETSVQDLSDGSVRK